MTIHVKIINEDSRKDAVIKISTQDQNGIPLGEPTFLTGGQDADYYVYKEQRLLIEETVIMTKE